MKNTLADLVNRNILPDDPALLKEMEQANELPDVFMSVVNFAKPGYEYVSPACLAITGYTSDAFLKGGPEFIFSITTQEGSLTLIKKIKLIFLNKQRLPTSIRAQSA